MLGCVSGNNGLYYIMQVISKLLDPKTSEHTASFVGRLVSIVITKVGQQLGENLDLMLRLVLSKMQQAETLSVMEVGAVGLGWGMCPGIGGGGMGVITEYIHL